MMARVGTKQDKRVGRVGCSSQCRYVTQTVAWGIDEVEGAVSEVIVCLERADLHDIVGGKVDFLHFLAPLTLVNVVPSLDGMPTDYVFT